MQRVRYCKKCRTVYTTLCPTCGQPGQIGPQVHLGRKLWIDVTITLYVDHRNRPYLLIQKPSGQERVSLTTHDFP
jgi:hypothetical protein